MSSIGEKIRLRRNRRGWLQSALAKASGISQPRLSDFELDKSVPNLEQMHAIEDALQLPHGTLASSLDAESVRSLPWPDLDGSDAPGQGTGVSGVAARKGPTGTDGTRPGELDNYIATVLSDAGLDGIDLSPESRDAVRVMIQRLAELEKPRDVPE